MKDETVKTVIAQVCITALAGFALMMGFDGTILGFALASLANSGQFVYGKAKSN